MRIDFINEYVVKVTLSKRNLESLLSKVDRPESTKMLHRIHGLDRVHLYVAVEDDATHYADREPGPVHPLDDPC